MIPGKFRCRLLLPFCGLLAPACAAAPADAPRVLYFEFSLVSIAAVHEGRATIENSVSHPGVAAISGSDVSGEWAAFASIDPQDGSYVGGPRVQFLNLRTGERGRVLKGRDSRGIGPFALSPDGRSAALGYCTVNGCRIDIEDMLTGQREKTAAIASNDSTIRWSPDGSRIAYATPAGELALYDFASRQVRLLGSGLYPAWSPDGQSLAFATEYEIRITDLSNPREMTVYRQPPDDPFLGAYLGWSPDGRYISFNSSTGQFPNYRACRLIDLRDKSVKTIFRGTGYCGPWLPNLK